MTFQGPASSANGWLGGTPTENVDDNVDGNVKMDIQIDNREAGAQEENQDVTMGPIGSFKPIVDDVASEMILMAMG